MGESLLFYFSLNVFSDRRSEGTKKSFKDVFIVGRIEGNEIFQTFPRMSINKGYVIRAK